MTKKEILTAIAKDCLGIETLERRNRDRLDFHDVSVSRLKEALEAAFEAGRKMTALSEDEFLTRYRPMPNVLNDNASFDFGGGGCLYETYGEELEHVRRQQEGYVWTIIEGENALVIASGYHLVNRLGYILTEVPADNDACIEVLLDQEMGDS